MYKRIVNLTLSPGRVIPIEVTSARRNGDWFVAATANIDGTPVTLTATASENLVRAALQKLGKLPAPSTGGFFDDIKKSIARFARSKALQSVLSGVATLANNPLVREIAGFYGPLQKGLEYVGKGASAAAAAQSLIMRGRQKDPKALATIKTIYEGAKNGNPQAKLMHQVLASVNKNAKQETAAQKPAAPPQQMAWMQTPFFGPPVSAGAAFSDPDLMALARTLRANA